MIESKQKWNKKYADKSTFSLEPDKFLVDNVKSLKGSSVLDFACGVGRNALWLARQGFEVTGADISDVGLKHLDQMSKDHGLVIDTIEMDLSDTKAIKKLGSYDNITVIMYKPSLDAIFCLPKLLTDDGILMICTHNWQQAEAGKFNEKFALNPEEYIGLDWGMELLKYDRFETAVGFYDGYVFKKYEAR